MRLLAGGIAALVAGGLVAFLEVWTIVPAPTLALLPLAVIVPELTPWGIAAALVAGCVAGLVGRGWPRTLGVAASAFALGCALVPVCLLPQTLQNCTREFQAVAGDATASPPDRTASLAARPYDLRAAFGTGDVGGAARVRLDLPVRLRDGTRLGLDLYLPHAAGPHPTIVLIYGGAWIFGTRAESATLARRFAALGYTAIAVDYRHAPRARFPIQLEDVTDDLTAIARNAAAWQVDPHRVAIFGRSAGAQLALLAAYRPSPLSVRAVIAYYSPIDLTVGYAIPPRPDPADVRRILRAYLGGTPAELPQAYRAASPLEHVHADLPPTLLIEGGRDELVRLGFAHEFRDAVRARGGRIAALDLPWSNHAFDTVPGGTGGQIARYYSERFIAATL